jgi:hypothetical protein
VSRIERLLAAGVVAAAAALPLAGCAEVESETSEGYQPAKLEPVKGRDDLQRVTFTPEGARRIGLRTAPVERAGAKLVMPHTALLYDAEGGTFAYTSPAPRTFLRVPVEVDTVDGGRVVMSAGPAAGTAVVTVGAAEVRGAELDIAGSH